MDAAEGQIRAVADAETAAWNARHASALAPLFHPDTVWRGLPLMRAGTLIFRPKD
jgi:hypothetical protein